MMHSRIYIRQNFNNIKQNYIIELENLDKIIKTKGTLKLIRSQVSVNW